MTSLLIERDFLKTISHFEFEKFVKMSSNKNEKINCKECIKEVLKSKLIMHISRRIENCKEVYDHLARSDNRDSKKETKKRFNNGYNSIYPPSIQSGFWKKTECDEHTQAKLSALESQMEELFNLMEN